ncbi:ABC transporter permease [Caproiciproducens sp.]|uniref:ABC transporter permease n=1 Tax=Caproiciproducens sp. TaxID=1954376 RepID=UPI002897C76A|nr:ABC transporter permease [Caproiciproducens sp.]
MKSSNSISLSRNMSRFAIYFVLIAMIVFFSVVADGFASPDNYLNILRQVAVNGISAVGMTFVILTGGIDISVGSIIGVAGIGTATMMIHGVSPAYAVLLMLVCGLLIGIFNAFFIYEIKLPPMIATLATMSILRGVSYIISGGLPVYGFPRSFTVLGQGYLGPIPVPVLILAVCFAAGYFVLEKTAVGRYVYGIGSNIEASRLSGINVRKVMYMVYGICGVLSALAGIVLLSRVNSGQPKAGETYEMDIITATVLGGISSNGGEGKIVNVIVGLLLMGVLLNGMIMMNIPDYYQRVVKGFVLLLAISYDKMSQIKANKKA